MTGPGPDPAITRRFRIASYNIRKAVGLDWRRDGLRIAKVLQEIDADIVVLQEADKRLGNRPGVLPARHLSQELGYAFADLSTSPASHGWHGNALLFRPAQFAPRQARRLNLPRFEPRGAVSVLFETPQVEIVGVHLGLTPGMRRKQIAALRDLISKAAHPVVIAGDFNSALRKSTLDALFGPRATSVSPGQSFHATRPFAALDRFVLANGAQEIESAVHHSALSRLASDHLPIVMDVHLAPAAGQRPTDAGGLMA